MEIDIQVGNDEQKAQIKDEIFEIFSNSLIKQSSVYKVIVPIDFDKTIQKIAIIDYQSRREDLNIEAMAKVIKKSEGAYVILSSKLFSDAFNNLTRAIFFLHEIIHINNERIDRNSIKISDNLIDVTNWLYDEYLANYISWKTIFNTFTDKIDSIEKMYQVFIDGFLEDVANYNKMFSIINEIKKMILEKSIDFDSGFSKIKSLIYDNLLKTVYITALENSKGITLDTVFEKHKLNSIIKIIVNEFSCRVDDYPKWIDDPSLLIDIYKMFGIEFDLEDPNNERILIK